MAQLAGAGSLLPALGNLFSAFDIIGVDPRGIGLSNQVQCNSSIFLEPVSMFPQNQSQFDKLVDYNKRLGQSCKDMTGPVIEHIDTMRYVQIAFLVTLKVEDTNSTKA